MDPDTGCRMRIQIKFVGHGSGYRLYDTDLYYVGLAGTEYDFIINLCKVCSYSA